MKIFKIPWVTGIIISILGIHFLLSSSQLSNKLTNIKDNYNKGVLLLTAKVVEIWLGESVSSVPEFNEGNADSTKLQGVYGKPEIQTNVIQRKISQLSRSSVDGGTLPTRNPSKEGSSKNSPSPQGEKISVPQSAQDFRPPMGARSSQNLKMEESEGLNQGSEIPDDIGLKFEDNQLVIDFFNSNKKVNDNSKEKFEFINLICPRVISEGAICHAIGLYLTSGEILSNKIIFNKIRQAFPQILKTPEISKVTKLLIDTPNYLQDPKLITQFNGKDTNEQERLIWLNFQTHVNRDLQRDFALPVLGRKIKTILERETNGQQQNVPIGDAYGALPSPNSEDLQNSDSKRHIPLNMGKSTNHSLENLDDKTEFIEYKNPEERWRVANILLVREKELMRLDTGSMKGLAYFLQVMSQFQFYERSLLNLILIEFEVSRGTEFALHCLILILFGVYLEIKLGHLIFLGLYFVTGFLAMAIWNSMVSNINLPSGPGVQILTFLGAITFIFGNETASFGFRSYKERSTEIEVSFTLYILLWTAIYLLNLNWPTEMEYYILGFGGYLFGLLFAAAITSIESLPEGFLFKKEVDLYLAAKRQSDPALRISTLEKVFEINENNRLAIRTFMKSVAGVSSVFTLPNDIQGLTRYWLYKFLRFSRKRDRQFGAQCLSYFIDKANPADLVARDVAEWEAAGHYKKGRIEYALLIGLAFRIPEEQIKSGNILKGSSDGPSAPKAIMQTGQEMSEQRIEKLKKDNQFDPVEDPSLGHRHALGYKKDEVSESKNSSQEVTGSEVKEWLSNKENSERSQIPISSTEMKKSVGVGENEEPDKTVALPVNPILLRLNDETNPILNPLKNKAPVKNDKKKVI